MATKSEPAPMLQRVSRMQRFTVGFVAVVFVMLALGGCGVGIDDPEGFAAVEASPSAGATATQEVRSTETRPSSTPDAPPAAGTWWQLLMPALQRPSRTVGPQPGCDSLPQDPEPMRRPDPRQQAM